jgi:integrase
MPTLYRPKVTTYTLPDGSYRTPDGERVTSKTPGAVKRVGRSKTWFGRYTDGAGRRHQVKLSASKETARRMLAKLAGDAQLAGVGIVDPFADHRARPLAGTPENPEHPGHLEDFGRYLAAKGNTEDYVSRTVARCRAVLDGCGFEHTDDLQASAVVEFLGSLREAGTERVPLPPGKAEYTKAELVAVLGIHHASVARMLRCHGVTATGNGKARRYPRATVEALQDVLCRGHGPTTCNHYLTAVKGFTRWLARDNRILADPLGHLSRQNADADIRRRRRALREDAFARFVEAAAAGKPFRGIGGPDRLVLYTLAANTGFRAGELASLTPRSFDLDAIPPTVTVQAGYSKHRREDVQPLRPDVAAMMRTYLVGKAPDKPIWPGTWSDDAAEMIRADLAAAGIPYQDDAGRHFDFHAVRGQFISLLAARGVHPKVAQVLARHSTITLTMDYYTHLDVLDVTGALDRLPGVTTPNSAGECKARPA